MGDRAPGGGAQGHPGRQLPELEQLDASGVPFRPIYDSADCRHWPRTEFANGEMRGPFHLCFTPSSAAPPLKLRWSPDMGLFCCRAVIVLLP